MASQIVLQDKDNEDRGLPALGTFIPGAIVEYDECGSDPMSEAF